MKEEDYLQTQQQIFLMAALVRELPLAEFIDAIDRAETAAPFLDPSLYRIAQLKVDMIKMMAVNLRKFQRELPTIEECNRADELAAGG